VSVIPDTSPRGPQVPAADQTLRILRHLATRPAPVAASAVARDLGLPRSTVHHLLNTLASHGFVLHLREERRWALGTAASELAGGFARQQPLTRLGRPLVAVLADRLGESAHLGVLSASDVVYIVEERAPRRPALVTDVGVRLPAHLTATGRAMLAALPREQVRALYPSVSAFSTRTGRGPTRPGELRELLRSIRAAGHASEDGEVTPGTRSVGAAVLDTSGWPIAAFAVTWSSDTGPGESAAATAVTEVAAELQRRLR